MNKAVSGTLYTKLLDNNRLLIIVHNPFDLP